MAIKSFLSEGGFSVGSVGSTPIDVISSTGAITTSSITVSGGGSSITTQDLTVNGTLVVNGSTVTLNSTTTTLDDPIITLGGDTAPTVDDNKDRGVEFRWHNGSLAKVGFFGYDDSTGKFVFIPDATNTSEVFSGTVGALDLSGSLSGGTGISFNGSTGAITNTGVTSITGTSNQVTASAGTGAVTLSLPQNIHIEAQPTFNTLTAYAFYLRNNNTNYIDEGYGFRFHQPSGAHPVQFEKSIRVGAINASGTDYGSGNVYALGSGYFGSSTAATPTVVINAAQGAAQGGAFGIQGAGTWLTGLGTRAAIVGSGTDQSTMLQSYADNVFIHAVGSTKAVYLQINSTNKLTVDNTSTTVAGNLTVQGTGDSTIAGTLGIGGAAYYSAKLTVDGNSIGYSWGVTNTRGGHITTITNPDGGTTASNIAFRVNNSSGTTLLQSTYGGAVTVPGTLTVNGAEAAVYGADGYQLKLGYSSAYYWKIGRNSSGTLIFNDSATDQISFTNTGRLGIGTTAPGSILQLGNYAGNPELTFAAVNNGVSKINFYDNNSTEGVYIKSAGEAYGGQLLFGARWDDDEDKIVFKMYQVSAGASYHARVGIGTTSPTQGLHLNSGVLRISGGGASSNGEINLDSGTEFDGWQVRKESSTMWSVKSVTSGNDLAVFVDNTTGRGVYIKTGGNVGINNTNPAYKLDVGGPIRTTDWLYIENSGYGIYSNSSGLYLSTAGNNWDISSGAAQTWAGLRLYTGGKNVTWRGHFYGDSTGQGFLDSGGNWQLIVDSSSRLRVYAGVYNMDSGIRVLNPGGAAYSTNSATVGGAWKIKLPTDRFKSNTMMRMTIKIYRYSTGTSTEFNVGGYNYSDAAANWYNVFAEQQSDGFQAAYTIRFGNDGTANCIWIGETNSTWDYPQVFVTDFEGGYSGTTQAWASGWSITPVTAFDTVTQTRTAAVQVNSNNIGNYGVNYITGTANQVLVNGGSGSNVTGGVTLTLPQNIHTGATPTFAGGTMTGTLSMNVDNGYVLFNRTATNKYTGISYRTASSEKWFAGIRELSNDNYYIYNGGLGANAITVAASDSAVTLAGNLTVKGSGQNAFGSSFTPLAWGVGSIDVNDASGGIVAVYHNGSAKGYMAASSGGVDINTQGAGTINISTNGTPRITTNATATTVSGNLTVSGTGTSSFAGNVTVTGTGAGYTAVDTGSFVKIGNNQTGANLQLGSQSGTGAILQGAANGIGAFPLVAQPYGGNFLIGGTTDNGHKLEVTGNTLVSKLFISTANASYDLYNNGTTYLNGAVNTGGTLTIGSTLAVSGTGTSTFGGDATFNKNGNIQVTLSTASTTAGATNRLRFISPTSTSDVRSGVIEWYKDGSTFMGDLRFKVAGGIEIRNSADQVSFTTDDSKNAAVYGNLTVSGNLIINGTTTTVNSTTTTLDDPIITLGGDTAPTVDDNKDRGVEFRWHNGTAAKVGFFGYDDSTGYFTFIPDATNSSEVFSGTQGDIQATNFRGNLIGNVTGNVSGSAGSVATLTAGTYLTGGSFNGSANVTFAVDATSTNTASKVVARDVNGDFSARIITATTFSGALSGNSSTTTKLNVTDSRNTADTPETISMGIVADFKANSTNGLSDGGTYNGVLTFRQYGSTTDWSGGASHQLGFTDNGNVWQRSGQSTSWSSWKKMLDSSNYNSYALPLTGGTLTGDLRFNNSGYGRIAFTDNYHGMVLRGYPSDATGTITAADVTSLIQHSGDFRFYRVNGSVNTLIFKVDNTAPYYKTDTIWHAGNDGSGSGLDADTLDGYNSVIAGGTQDIRSKVLVASSTGNISSLNPESYSGEVRLGAAWNRGGIYTSSTLSLSTNATETHFVFGDIMKAKVSSAGRIDASSYYDIDDTTYYLDPSYYATTSPGLNLAGHLHIGSQAVFDNPGSWSRTILVDGTNHARVRVRGSAYASGNNNVNEVYMWVDNSVAAPYGGLYGDYGLKIASGNSSHIALLPAGNVGIGTTSPLQTLQLKNNGWIGIGAAAGTYIPTAWQRGGNGGIILSSSVNSDGSGWSYGSRLIQSDFGDGLGLSFDVNNASSWTNDVLFISGRSSSLGKVGIGTTSPGYKLEVNGSFAATTKSFVIKHPTKEGKKLRYGSLEGPENGVYVRGKLKGSNVIELPDYWTKLVDPESITVQLTPIGSHQKLYVEKIEDNKVYIANENLLSKAINCFFYVLAERCDVEKLEVEIDA